MPMVPREGVLSRRKTKGEKIMRGTGFRNAVAENLTTVTPSLDFQRHLNTRWKMCWRCQQNKSPIGGHMKIVPGLMKFICKDCMDKKKESAI